MIYCDFVEEKTVVFTLWGKMSLPRYAAFTGTNMMPRQALYEAKTIIAEGEGKIYWVKNRYINKQSTELTAEELKQFLFQKLASEVVR